ncbi:Lipoprotein releasing system ATP-binding protein LolD [Liberibacter crescens BT-1]|uniref:Lipoprotein releasing system ATP-binding protein LolD n=1 Tax=Liberibacter crescens (strain BT-1) TaxID=1215343 RepID=L0EUC7_LIBCB|nr:ABC transporter ATP-binding protein [Liberibacter crescens]AGA64268.1 Lipoprotein releasing system ATP-binding protein LolD [Liberibacter crescens BT-1]AMC12501.1 ABC transporter [Liberibacter crescens]
MITEFALELKGVIYNYKQEDNFLPILRGVDLSLKRGEIVALIAPSGAGKSTLLHIAGLLEKPDSGEIIINGKSCIAMSDKEKAYFRCTQIGFVYQFHHLLIEFSALENIIIPQIIAGLCYNSAFERAQELLNYMRIGNRGKHKPFQLSGGEQQRVAICRAIANGPLVLLADEPTGNLDPQTALHVFDVLGRLVKQSGLAAIIATHNHELAARMNRQITIKSGIIVEL